MTRLFFDGGCGLCCGLVRFAARQDRSGRIRFAPLGGETFQQRVAPAFRKGLPDSFVVLTPEGELLTLSGALVHILRRMGGGWRRVGLMLAWIPEPLRDWAYHLIARLRPRGRACAWEAREGDARFDP